MYRTEQKDQPRVSKGLLQALVQSKQDEMASSSLIAALEGTTSRESAAFKDQFKLLDLVSTEGGEQISLQEKELLKPPQQPISKP